MKNRWLLQRITLRLKTLEAAAQKFLNLLEGVIILLEVPHYSTALFQVQPQNGGPPPDDGRKVGHA